MVLGSAENPWPEIWLPAANTWTINYSAILNEYKTYSFDDYAWYPWLHLAPNGKLFYSGPTPGMSWVDPNGAGASEDLGQSSGYDPETGGGCLARRQRGQRRRASVLPASP